MLHFTIEPHVISFNVPKYFNLSKDFLSIQCLRTALSSPFCLINQYFPKRELTPIG